MPSFREVHSLHAPLLILDAASSRVQVGFWPVNDTPRWHTSDDEAGVAVFTGVKRLNVNLAEVGAFVFCDGPGSILGIRTVAMALRTWCTLQPRPIFAYTSLALVAHAAQEPNQAVIADARRDSWHHFTLQQGLRRVPTAALEKDQDRVTPEGFRNWTPLPDGTRRVPYGLSDLLPRVADVDLLMPTDAPDAFLHEEPSFVTWTPKIHQAPLPR